MTKKTNTELARVRAAAKALRSLQDAPQHVTVHPALLSTLADARSLVARELEMMKAVPGMMKLADAKKLQALVSTLATTQTIEKAQSPDLEALTDEQLEAELKKLGSGE